MGQGLPIGNLTSQHFANFYLGELDHFLKDRLGQKAYIRYMDDFISFSNNKKSLQDLLLQIDCFVQSRLKLALKEEVTTLAPVTEGIPFLGFRVYPSLIRIKRENLVRMRKKIRKKEALFRRGKISESDLSQSVRSVVAHVSHVNSLAQRRNIFSESLNLA